METELERQRRWNRESYQRHKATRMASADRWNKAHPELRNAAQRRRKAAAKERVRAIKVESGCVDCGYNAHADALEFDHLPQFQKLFAVGMGVHRAWSLVLAEIAKCEVVCANCHRIRTATRREAVAA